VSDPMEGLSPEDQIEFLKTSLSQTIQDRDRIKVELKGMEDGLGQCNNALQAEMKLKWAVEAELEELREVMGAKIEEQLDTLELRWTGDIADRVAKLPLSWAPSFVAKRIRDPKFTHPRGLRDCMPS
jgi:hypothetical protein